MVLMAVCGSHSVSIRSTVVPPDTNCPALNATVDDAGAGSMSSTARAFPPMASPRSSVTSSGCPINRRADEHGRRVGGPAGERGFHYHQRGVVQFIAAVCQRHFDGIDVHEDTAFLDGVGFQVRSRNLVGGNGIRRHAVGVDLCLLFERRDYPGVKPS